MEADLALELQKNHVERANTAENLRVCHSLRWRSGPLFLRFSDPNFDGELDKVLEEACKDAESLVSYFLRHR